MGEKKPLISICIPTYNGEKYLQEALDSVKNQTYKNIEVIISDDQSQDRTIEICQQLKEEVDFPVFIYSHKPNGIGANWNHCIEKTNGEYIKFLFQDDILEAECIEKMLHYSIDNNLSIVICKRHIIDSNSNIVVSNPWVDNYGDLQKEAGLEVNEFRIFNKNDINSIHFYRFMYLNIFGEPCASLFKKNIINKILPQSKPKNISVVEEYNKLETETENEVFNENIYKNKHPTTEEIKSKISIQNGMDLKITDFFELIVEKIQTNEENKLVEKIELVEKNKNLSIKESSYKNTFFHP